MLSFPALAAAAAARRRAIFCCGVSPGNAPRPGVCMLEGVKIDELLGLEVALGIVAVKRVASDADRAMIGGETR